MLKPRCCRRCYFYFFLSALLYYLGLIARTHSWRLHQRLSTAAQRRRIPSLLPRRLHHLSLLPLDGGDAVLRRGGGGNVAFIVDKTLRGGGDVSIVVDDDDDEEEDSEQDEDESEEEETEEDNEDESEDDDDESDDASSSQTTTTTDTPSPLLPPLSSITIQTMLGSPLLEESVELIMVKRQRTILSLKESICRQLPSRPPVSALQLYHQGHILDDDMLVEELIDEDDEDDDDDDDESSQSPISEEESSLVLQLDMIPTVHPKTFLQELDEKIPHMTSRQLLEAYSLNEAAIHQNAMWLFKSASSPSSSSGNDEHEEEEEEYPSIHHQQQQHPVHVVLREQAERIRDNLETTLLQTDRSRNLLEDPEPPSLKQQQAITEIKGQRVRNLPPGGGSTGAGVKMTWKRSLQKSLNVDWGTTVRHVALFLFFGWFGGRTPLSRAILLLGAPSVLVLQARPVKLYIRQFLYALFDQPPGVVLSLLPAPQQSILSLQVHKAMRAIYGDAIPQQQQRQQQVDEDADTDVSSTGRWDPRTRDQSDDYDDDDEEEDVDDDDEYSEYDDDEEEEDDY